MASNPPANTSRASSLLNALAQLYQSAGNEMNTGLGALAGLAMTRKLPNVDENGRLIFEAGADSQSPPMAMGDTLIVPTLASTSERSLAHEAVHQQQSHDYGFAYPLLSALGGRLGPLEQEALKSTIGTGPKSPDGQTSTDDLADKLELEDTQAAEDEGGPLMRALYALYKARPQVKADE